MTLPPRRSCRPTLLIVGCGDVGMRVLRLLQPQWRVFALTSSPARMAQLRQRGAVPVLGDLDQPASLARLHTMLRLADAVLHLAPPPATGSIDTRTQHLLRLLARASALQRLVYGSTSGVYGDCGGAWVDETRPLAPATARAQRRVDAEAQLRHFGRRTGTRVNVLRIPGIYASDRPGGHPRERLLRSTPVLRPEVDVFTNHIHADDLARACVAALWRGAPQRVYHTSDNTELKMGDYFDLAADLCALPRPPRLSRAEAAEQLSPMAQSFLGESRRLHNRRLREELRLKLRYPTVVQGLQDRATEITPAVVQPMPGALFAMGGD